MKKFRFFSVAVAVVAVLFSSVWAGSSTIPLTTLNGFATGETSLKCFTLNGPSSSNLTSPVTFTGKLSSACNPSIGYIKFYKLVGAQQTLVGNSSNISLNTNVSNVQISIPANLPANGSYCVSGYVKYNNSNTQSTSCGITLTGSVTINWAP